LVLVAATRSSVVAATVTVVVVVALAAEVGWAESGATLATTPYGHVQRDADET